LIIIICILEIFFHNLKLNYIIKIFNLGVLVTDENDDMYGAALRGLFIIDPKGVVRSIQINDAAVGRSVDETLRLLKAFQWADSHVGEACPASWTPGQDTIKTNPYESKDYFKNHM
jgi:peroxiredoxin (alkyl hydroperoxide reductase subunit C)